MDLLFMALVVIKKRYNFYLIDEINKISMISDTSDEGAANNYFFLMSKVGNDATYQRIIFIISILLWVFYGVFVNSIPLLYLDVQFDCTSFGIP